MPDAHVATPEPTAQNLVVSPHFVVADEEPCGLQFEQLPPVQPEKLKLDAAIDVTPMLTLVAGAMQPEPLSTAVAVDPSLSVTLNVPLHEPVVAELHEQVEAHAVLNPPFSDVAVPSKPDGQLWPSATAVPSVQPLGT